ncbi:MAG: hypothetical protein PHP14_01620, partial [Candidatus Pacebacteria bacterium]|nr:hypothetical protein [Candidatus Paceibacterota bacterium]
TSTTTTTTTKPVTKDSTCYRCSYPHGTCIAVKDGCKDSDYYSFEECIKETPCIKGYPSLRGAPQFYTCDVNTQQCVGSISGGPTFVSYTDCVNSCSKDFDNIFNNKALPDLVTRIVKVTQGGSAKKCFSTIIATVKNVGRETAVCKLSSGQEVPFRNCISGITVSSMPCKSGMQ